MENRLKEEFLKMEIPDMKEDIMKNAKKENAPRERRRIRPAAVIVMAALVLVLAVTVGAAAGGMLRLNSGSKYLFKGENGEPIQLTGFHMDEDVDAHLSEKALENISPYIFTPGESREFYETADPSEMEAVLDMSLRLPGAIRDHATLYRLWASGADGEAVSIHVQIGTEEDVSVMEVYLLGNPGSIAAAADPVFDSYELPDGTPVSIAVAESRNGGMTGHALYEYRSAVYHISITAEDDAAVLGKLRGILDTVG